MARKDHPEPKRRGLPKHSPSYLPKGRILRPFEKWLLNLFTTDIWVDSREGGPWLAKLREIASAHGCRLICDRMRHYRESIYLRDYKNGGPTILAGGASSDGECCTAILHELGHHILHVKHHHPGDPEEGEKAAWRVAQKIAREHRLPCDPKVKSSALYSYRYREILLRTAGSKRKTRQRPQPHSWVLENSRRSSAASANIGLFSTGKKGKRHAKRFIKKKTAKAERRRPLRD